MRGRILIVKVGGPVSKHRQPELRWESTGVRLSDEGTTVTPRFENWQGRRGGSGRRGQGRERRVGCGARRRRRRPAGEGSTPSWTQAAMSLGKKRSAMAAPGWSAPSTAWGLVQPNEKAYWSRVPPRQGTRWEETYTVPLGFCKNVIGPLQLYWALLTESGSGGIFSKPSQQG
jgi:hypothetical protein